MFERKKGPEGANVFKRRLDQVGRRGGAISRHKGGAKEDRLLNKRVWYARRIIFVFKMRRQDGGEPKEGETLGVRCLWRQRAAEFGRRKEAFNEGLESKAKVAGARFARGCWEETGGKNK